MSLYLQRLVARNLAGPLLPVIRPAPGTLPHVVDPFEQIASEPVLVSVSAGHTLPLASAYQELAPVSSVSEEPGSIPLPPAQPKWAPGLPELVWVPDRAPLAELPPEQPAHHLPAESPSLPEGPGPRLQAESVPSSQVAGPPDPVAEASVPSLARPGPHLGLHSPTVIAPSMADAVRRGYESMLAAERDGQIRPARVQEEPLLAAPPPPRAELRPAPPALPHSMAPVRVAIGHLSVEVLPAPAPPPPSAPRQALAVSPRPGSDEVSSSMLRFGMGQL